MLISTQPSKLVLILLCLLVYLILPVTSLPLPARSSKKSKKTYHARHRPFSHAKGTMGSPPPSSVSIPGRNPGGLMPWSVVSQRYRG
ncbi:hypothetical protein BKA70DRAFT_1307625 [Coprinopsis sp. MPI-PUGE-AT-0042]|nr:hypothetical protein BKA70DRAFT_1307625 [Coprinopsis sp. MPI-PUGE-AT-0042]